MRRAMLVALVGVLAIVATVNAEPGVLGTQNTIFLPLVQRAHVPTNNLPVLAATYLGGAGADNLAAVDVAPNGEVVAGGVLPGVTLGATPTTLLGGGNGAVVRLSSDGRRVVSVTRIGATVTDLEVDAAGRIAVCGAFGVALLDGSAGAALWSATPGSVSRCAVGGNGTVAALVGNAVFVYGADGAILGNWTVGGNAHNDLAVDSGTQSVIVTGYTQTSADLQVAFVRSWGYNGGARWTSYGFSDAAVKAQNILADTRGERVAIGRDGKLYFAGSINGGTGASIFARDPKNVALRLGSDRNVQTDSYNTATNTGSIKMTWFGRYNPATGDLERGSSLLTRLSSGRGNSITPRAIAADESGNVLLAGDTACCLPSREARQIGGVAVGPYSGGEAYLAVLRSDFRERLVWTPFAGSSGAGGSPAAGVAVRGGTAALGITLNNGSLITANAIQPTPGTLPDGYIAVWRP